MHSLMKPGQLLTASDRTNLCLRALSRRAGSTAMDELSAIAHCRTFKAGATIIPAGEPMQICGIVLSGVVKLTRTIADGREQIVGLMFASDFVGRAFADTSPFAAVAATDVDMCVFDKAAFERLLQAHPDVEHQLLCLTLDELDAAREWILLLGCKSAEEKVASFLMSIARRAHKQVPQSEMETGSPAFELPISRSDMAAYLGTTVETVSRQITSLKTANIIRLKDLHHFVVPDESRLARAAGQ